MQVSRGREPEARVRQAPPDAFTGIAWIDPVLERRDGMAVNAVFFSPGARTHWHRHEAGQALYVTGGEGWVCSRGHEPVRVRTGDTVWTSPGEEHWHGASSHTYLLHLGFTLGTSEFRDPVTDDQYPMT